jgi:hypothetical protein
LAAGHDPAAVASLAIRAERLLDREVAGLDEAGRARALQKSPHHAAIVDLARRFTVTTRTIDLRARAEADDTRAGSHDVRVELTIAHPDDELIESKAARRQARILRVLGEAEQQGAAVRIQDLVELLAASPATIKRDLAELRDARRDVATVGSLR